MLKYVDCGNMTIKEEIIKKLAKKLSDKERLYMKLHNIDCNSCKNSYCPDSSNFKCGRYRRYERSTDSKVPLCDGWRLK